MDRPPRLGLASLVVGAAGAIVLFRTLARRVPIALPSSGVIEVRRAVTIDANAARIRECLRRPETWLPGGIVESVAADAGRWRLTLRALGYEIANLEIDVSDETDGLRFAARASAGAGSYNGRVRLTPAPDQIGVEVHAAIRIEPAGTLAAALAGALDGAAVRALGHALHRFRQLVEAGEIARADVQPHARRGVVARTVKAVSGRREQAA
jgi:uncharacterized membrane protein